MNRLHMKKRALMAALMQKDGDLPSGYTQLEYIESTGTQWIDTGFTPLMGDEFSGRFMLNQNNSTLCSTSDGGLGTYRTGITFNVQGYSYYIYFTNKAASRFASIATDTWLSFSISSNGVLNIGGNSARSTPAGEIPQGDELRLLTGTNSGSYIRLSEFKISRAGTIVRNFIPAKRNSDDAVGLYDTVNGVFYANSGTGDFVAGAEVGPIADTLAVNIPAQTATLTAGGVSTDVSDMQDWEQDFTLVRGDNTVSIGTTVQPSAVEWRYLSSRKGE